MANGWTENDIRYHHAEETRGLRAELNHSEHVREMVTNRLHTVEQSKSELLAALKSLLSLAEADAVTIDGEWGLCRTLEQLDADGDLPDEILTARVAIARAEPKT